MIMPFIRLLTIYALVIVAVVAFFKRDTLMQISSATIGWPASETEGDETGASDNQSTDPQTEQETEQSAAVTPAPATTQQPSTSSTLPVIQMPVADPEDEPVTEAASAPSQDAVIDTQTHLKAARQAYWKGDLAGSSALYAALAKAAPDDPDVNGEFGNILFAQRQFDDAADAYLITGKLLVEKGQKQQVQPIIDVLQNIAPKKAATLRALANN